MPAKKPAKQKHKYQILVNSYQTYQFDVEAESAEKACSTLQRKLRDDGRVMRNCPEKPVFSAWTIPSEPHEQWAVMRTTPIGGTNFLLLSKWDGKSVTGFAEAEIGDNIVQALMRVVDPRSSKSKLKKKA